MRGVDQVPWLYDALMAFTEWRGLGRWRRWLVGGARWRTLDIGCGSGRNLSLYAPGALPVGADPSPDNLRAARRRAPGVPLVRARAEALPFKAGAFETVVSGMVFCSVTEPARALAEVRRVLAPSGALRMLEHVRSRSPFWSRAQDLLQPVWTRAAGGCHPNRDTEGAVRAAGFTFDPEGRRERGTLRRFQARPAG